MVQHLVRDWRRDCVNSASGFKVVKVLADDLQGHIVVTLHGEDVPQAFNIGLGVLAVPSVSTLGVHQSAFFEEANLRSANAGEVQV